MSNEITVQNQEVITLIEQLKNKSIGFYGVPKEYRNHPLIAATERSLGIRKAVCKGYDIILNKFFVDERIRSGGYIAEEICTIYFDNFSDYYDFLQGDIYKNACYYGYCFQQELMDKYSIDLGKLNFRALIDDTIDDFTIAFSKSELAEYRRKETKKKAILSSLRKLNDCKTYDEFQKQMDLTYRFKGIPLWFFLSNFIFHNKEKAFDIVMEYINHISSLDFEEKFCLIYEPDAVLAKYKNTFYSKSTAKKHEKRLREFIPELKSGNIKLYNKIYFDEKTHFFVFCTIGRYESDSKVTKIVEMERYFETFESLMEFRGNDLSDCDLSRAILLDVNLSKYKIGSSSKFPIQYQKDITYSLKKQYDRRNALFVVDQKWKNAQGVSIKFYRHTFQRFFDFAYFLKGDLSEADLLFCDGLINLHDIKGLNLDKARLRSAILDKFGVKYDIAFNSCGETFPAILQNEEETSKALMLDRETYNFEESFDGQIIYYVSDLHLIHRLANAKCKSVNDVDYIIQNVIDSLLSKIKSSGSIMLIGGDTSSDFSIFKQFINMLRKTLDDRRLNINIVFVLGNHELWGFPQSTLDKIVTKYKRTLIEKGMFLLQNNIIFKYNLNDIGEISTEELKTLSSKELRNRLTEARVVLFGGLAFAGYNEKINANLHIYKDTINREQEIEETKNFEKLYLKVCTDLSDKRVIVFTHMPQTDWYSDVTLKSGFVYVNGHTHKNSFYDDGYYRIYADNQIGYKRVNVDLKYFYIDDDYDIFAEYEDGMYELSREQYINFYHGKNIGLTFNREFHRLFMLKKKGYYMFILQYPSGKLAILNGGALKSLEQIDINYYFDRMDEVIAYIERPLNKFTEYQKQISKAIKAIGGIGTIHGAIVDIDFLNHIYVNPLDLTITPYYAIDMVQKKIFSNIQLLLQSNCPDLYNNYLKQIETNASLTLALQEKEKNSETQLYLETDIYRASREIKKMQKLSSNILSIWIEPSTKKLQGKND